MEPATKRSFWRFGGKLDSIYNWLVAVFFILSCVVQFGRFKGDVPTALGTAIGQTVVVAVILFLLFKLVSALKKS